MDLYLTGGTGEGEASGGLEGLDDPFTLMAMYGDSDIQSMFQTSTFDMSLTIPLSPSLQRAAPADTAPPSSPPSHSTTADPRSVVDHSSHLKTSQCDGATTPTDSDLTPLTSSSSSENVAAVPGDIPTASCTDAQISQIGSPDVASGSG